MNKIPKGCNLSAKKDLDGMSHVMLKLGQCVEKNGDD